MDRWTMYTVEKIGENIVDLEDRNTNIIIHIDRNILPNNINEGDIIDYINNEYTINNESTKKIKENIKNRFKNLIE